MHVQSAQRAASLRVVSIGHLVPRHDGTGRVHSVFARACNIDRGDLLLTLCTFDLPDGPSTLRLARGASCDLREWFASGEPVEHRGGCLLSPRVELPLTCAHVWRPAAPGRLLPCSRIDAHLRRAALRVAQRRRVQGSVIDRAAAPVLAALSRACRALDREGAARQVGRLIGWGEGLTPAGDDVLIGLIAGLDGLAHGEERGCFRTHLAGALVAGAPRTTAIAAHHLRLAARGHYGEPLIGVRNALLGEADGCVVEAALDRALAIGATSGADTVSGLLAGLHAWSPALVIAEAA